jgi:hypothetical protein
MLEIGLCEIRFMEINPLQMSLVKISRVQIRLECLDIGIRLSPGIPKRVP